MSERKRYLGLTLATSLLALVGVLAWLGAWGGTAAVLAQPSDAYSVYYVARGGDCGMASPCYSTLQAAVDAADSPTDVVKVAAGTFNDLHQRAGITQVVYISKTITIRGGYKTYNWHTPDPAANVTLLDARNLGRGIFITGAISVTLEGLQVTRGNATGRPGLPTPFDGMGGGVYAADAMLTLRQCAFYGNTGSRGDEPGLGGGLYLYSGHATLISNTIYNNIAGQSTAWPGKGGGLALVQSEATLISNTLKNNIANNAMLASAPAYGGLGGGLYADGGSAAFHNTVIRDNLASSVSRGEGGGAWFGLGHRADLVNTALVNNAGGVATGSRGAGMASEGAAVFLWHTTLTADASGSSYGEGIYSAYYPGFTSSVALTNTIMNGPPVGVIAANSMVTLHGVLWCNSGANTEGSGVVVVSSPISACPSLAADGYHLAAGSPGIDVGVEAGVTDDIDGQPRPYGFAPDLGADELVIVLAPVAPGAGATLSYSDGAGRAIVAQVPPGAVTDSIMLAYTPLPSPTMPISTGLRFANHAFDLDAYRNGSVLIPGFRFAKPVTITIYYSNTNVAGIAEDSLRLYYWAGSAWEDAAATCTPPSAYANDPARNMLRVPICHLSRYGMMGRSAEPPPSWPILLPLILRNLS